MKSETETEAEQPVPSHAPTSAARLRVRRRVNEAEEVVAARDRVRRRLKDLYRVGRHIALFSGGEGAFSLVLSVIAETLPMKSAVLVEQRGDRSVLIAWIPDGTHPGALTDARTSAYASYVELVHDPLPLDEAIDDEPRFLPTYAKPEANGNTPVSRLAFPLAASNGVAFGVLQLEIAAPLDESDLAFLHACSGQLGAAIARDRDRVEEHADSAERLSWLSVTDPGVAATDDERTLLSLTHVLGHVSLVCAVDLVSGLGLPMRILSAIRSTPPRARLDALLDRLLDDSAVGPQLLTGDGTALGLPTQEQETAREIGLHSWIRVPLEVGGRRLGVLILLAGHGDVPFDDRLFQSILTIADRATRWEESTRKLREALVAVQYRDELLGTVSHDLRTPLSAIMITADSMLNSDARAAHRIQLVRRAAKRMHTMVTDLLDVASIHARKLALDVAEGSLAEVIEEAAEEQRGIATAKEIAIEVASSTLPTVLLDRHRTHRILANLIGNAIKFSSAGSVVTIRATVKERMVRVVVGDTGPGIGALDLPHVFERFWQSSDGSAHGAGLGLYIVKSFVEAQGGTVSVRSALGVGTRFAFTLRVAP